MKQILQDFELKYDNDRRKKISDITKNFHPSGIVVVCLILNRPVCLIFNRPVTLTQFITALSHIAA